MALPTRNRRRGSQTPAPKSEIIHCPPSWNHPTVTGVSTSAEQSGASLEFLLPATKRPAVQAVTVAPAVHERLSVLPSVIPARQCHTLQEVRIFSQNGVVIDRENRVIKDLSPDFRPRESSEHRLLRYTGLPEPRPLSGHVFSLVSAASWKNYFHWLIDTLPTARFVNWGDYDTILAPSCRAYHRESFEAIGLPPEKLVPLEHETHFSLESLSTIPRGEVALITPCAVAYLRSLFGVKPAAKPHRKLYLSRNDGWRRRITNEDEVFSYLEQFGFEFIVIGKRSVREQAALFAEASHVIGPHGAAMTNLVFSSPQTRLLECFSGTFLFPHFYHLCATLGQAYSAHWTENPADDPDGPIDLESFKLSVAALLGE